MQLQDFNFILPPNLIAQYPLKNRVDSNLLVVHPKGLEDKKFIDILSYLQPNDLIIFNNTKVIPARLYGKKSTGGKVELLLERILNSVHAMAHIRSSRSLKIGSKLKIADNFEVEIIGREDSLFKIALLTNTSQSDNSLLSLIETHGHIPLPPYIKRPDDIEDKSRYQTVYGNKPGAVAAPTAGLHFDKDIIKQIKQKGINFDFVTLHVGAGTFKPVQVNNINEHKMHSEFINVSSELVKKIKQTKQDYGRIIAVGTTTVRCLETAALHSNGSDLKPYSGETDIFITPGYDFKVIDVLLTNFHLPESTLIMLVSAFAGHLRTMEAYQHAIDKGYRFFSYGDAMLIFTDKR